MAPIHTTRSLLQRLLVLSSLSFAWWIAVRADQEVALRFTHHSTGLSLMELQTGSHEQGQEKVAVRRDRAARILEQLEFHAPHSLLSPEGSTDEADHVEQLDRLLTRGLWSALKIMQELDDARRSRLATMREDELIVFTSLRAGPTWFETELQAAFGPPGPVPADLHPPTDWDPTRDAPEAWEAWQRWVSQDPRYVPGMTLLDFLPQSLLITLILDQKDHPEQDLNRLKRRAAHARAFLEATLDFDMTWSLLESTLLLEARTAGRVEALPEMDKVVRPMNQFGDIPMSEFFHAVREARIRARREARP